MNCPACATENRDGVRFCSRCGSALPEPVAPGYQSAYPPPGQTPFPGSMQPSASYGGGGGIRGERRELPMTILLTFVTCGIYGMFLCYKYPKLINEMQAKRGLPVNDISTVTLLLAVFGLNIVSFAMMQNELNKIWESGR